MKKVYLFATCLGNAIFTQTSLNAIKLLRRENVEVVFKKDQTCCGQPSYNTGYFEDTRKIALYNMDLFSGDLPIIVPSGSCAGMMKHDYVELFKGTEYEEKARKFGERIYDLCEYLDKVLNVKYEDKGEKVKITWHSNCHALRVQKSIDSAKNLLAQLSNVEVVWLQREEECCGFGGTFAVKEPEISNAMVQEKIRDIEESGVQYLVSADGGCLMNIAGAMEKAGKNVKGIHLYDFLVKRIEGEAL